MEGSEISVQELVERFQLSHELLGESLSDEHLREASRIIDDHRILGPELGLKLAEMKAINQEQSPELQRLATLEKWKQKSAWKATYRKLIEALLKCSRADVAEQVCELLNQSKYKDRNMGSMV